MKDDVHQGAQSQEPDGCAYFSFRDFHSTRYPFVGWPAARCAAAGVALALSSFVYHFHQRTSIPDPLFENLDETTHRCDDLHG